jgi:MoaA/NifB/PqqE/SkfB family radical SAM enzyme
MTFNLTNRCNLRCDHCNFPANPSVELPTSEVLAAIDEFATAGMTRVSFSGGEALLRDDLPTLLAHAHRRQLFTSLNTNGLLARGRLDELVPNLDLLAVSLDGPAAHHDRVRGHEGAFDAAVECARLAGRAGTRVATITVLRGDDLDVVPPVLELAREHGFWAYFQPRQLDCFDVRAGSALKPSALAALAAALRRGRAAGLPVAASESYLEALEGRWSVRCETCLAGRFFGTVMADGTVAPCPMVVGRASARAAPARSWARTFREMPSPPPGPGCLVSPFREMDQILRLRGDAVRAAIRTGWAPSHVGWRWRRARV